MPKRIRTSKTVAPPWSTLPGNTGELRDESGRIADTIFGQLYASSETGLLMSTLTANGIFKGFAGYIATIKQVSGASVAVATAPTTSLGTNQYQITDVTKRLLERTATTNVFDNGVNQNANVDWIDFLHGIVKFVGSYTVVGPVTITSRYLPLTAVAKGRNF